jgi:SAM-dependent methyltransferase
MKRSFAKEYFDDKPLDRLRKAITGDWSDKNLQRHLALLNPPAKAKKILEIGCGLGRLLVPLYDGGAEHCVGVDASLSMVTEARPLMGTRNIQVLHCDGAGTIPLEKPGYFDWAFSIITFQHIPDTETVKRYLGEAHRLLKHWGRLTFQVLSHDVKPDRELWAYHDLDALTEHLNDMGFKGQWEGAGVWAIYQRQKWKKQKASQ